MPARIELLSGFADLSHAQLVEQRRDSSRNQQQALHPGVRGQLWWSGSQRTSKIIEYRYQPGEQRALGGNASLSLLLGHATPVIHEVRLRSPQHVQALFRLLLLDLSR